MVDAPCIKGFIETSFIDWKKQLSSVLFTGGCNFRCPYCHNSGLVVNHEKLENIPLDHIFLTLKKYKNWVDKVVITGGEPTIHKNLFLLARRLKDMGMQIKLDTNGSNPAAVRRLVAEGFVDYLAMDVKGPLDKYSRWCGVETDAAPIQESIDFIMEGHVDYEFRMTVVPFLHREEDVYRTAERIRGAGKFFIQEFRSAPTLNPTFAHIKPFPPAKMVRIRETVAGILRGAKREERENSEG
ncbi:MAG TPA: anaerobic ribonucleoside-triphosphate reductase activating protein [Syntrophorhabdaceae bacterium]|jgi:pyruvate formate lyase activating enzyme